MEFLAVVAVAVGGAAGSVARFLSVTWIRAWLGPGMWPLGTLGVNLSGSLLIGFFAALAEQGPAGIRPWVITGFLGGFTTFSAFSLENLNLMREGHVAAAAAYALASVLGGLALAYAGYSLGKLFC